LTYEVLCADSADGEFQRVNPADVICAAFLHVFPKTQTPKYYRVRAVDYWMRRGAESDAAALNKAASGA